MTIAHWLARALGVVMVAVLFVGAGPAGSVPLFPPPWDKLSHFGYFYLLARALGFGFRWGAGWVVLCGSFTRANDESWPPTFLGLR